VSGVTRLNKRKEVRMRSLRRNAGFFPFCFSGSGESVAIQSVLSWKKYFGL